MFLPNRNNEPPHERKAQAALSEKITCKRTRRRYFSRPPHLKRLFELIRPALSAGVLFSGVCLGPSLHAQVAGSLDSAFNPNVSGSYVLATAVQPDGKIVIGGSFSSVGGQPRSNFARLNPDGTVESTTTFNLGTGASGLLVADVAVQADGKIILGGQFSSVNGQPRNGIARLNADGTLESTATFNPGSGAVGGVFSSIKVQADGKILVGVFVGEDTVFEPLALISERVTGIPGATYVSFKDPVLAPSAASVAFLAKLRGSGIRAGNNLAVMFKSDGLPLRAVARAGGQPPGTLTGAKWDRFVSLALPGGSIGPIVHATMVRGAGGVTAANDAGVWAVDSTGTLRHLFREGDEVNGKTVKSFTVLNAVPGSPGVTRAFNNLAQVVWRAVFTDRSTGIVITSVP